MVTTSTRRTHNLSTFCDDNRYKQLVAGATPDVYTVDWCGKMNSI